MNFADAMMLDALVKAIDRIERWVKLTGRYPWDPSVRRGWVWEWCCKGDEP